MRRKMNDERPSNDGAPASAEVEGAGQRVSASRGWTLGDSGQLREGAAREPLAVTLGWIFGPILVFLLLLSLFVV